MRFEPCCRRARARSRVLRRGVVDHGRERVVVDLHQFGTRPRPRSGCRRPRPRPGRRRSGPRRRRAAAAGCRAASLPWSRCHCSWTPPLRSAAVNTCRTPGHASGGRRCRSRGSARGRTGCARSTRAACRAATRRRRTPCPVSSRASSTRRTRARPATVAGVTKPVRPRGTARRSRRARSASAVGDVDDLAAAQDVDAAASSRTRWTYCSTITSETPRSTRRASAS